MNQVLTSSLLSCELLSENVKLKGGFLTKTKSRILSIERDLLILYKTKELKKRGKEYSSDKSETRIVKLSVPLKSISINLDSEVHHQFVISTETKKLVINTTQTDECVNTIKYAISRATTDYLSNLPEEILITVFLHLPFIEIIKNVSILNKCFSQTVKKSILWKRWFFHAHPKSQIVDRDLDFLGMTWLWICKCKQLTTVAGFSGLGFHGTTFGEFLNGQLHGKCIVFADNARYIGEYKNGLKDGKGLLIFSKGDRIEGKFKNGRLVQGHLIRANGNQYQGEFKNNKYEGQGVLIKVTGKRYEGQFKNGSRHGYGVFVFADGSRYEGEFKNGKYDGHGVYVTSKGSRYEGDFKQGKYDGFGVYTNAVKGYSYSGEFRNGKFHGKGLLINKTKNTKYQGDFFNGWSEGQGVFFAPDGGRYDGQFVKGKYHGKGVFSKANGTTLVGEFKNGNFQGTGTAAKRAVLFQSV